MASDGIDFYDSIAHDLEVANRTSVLGQQAADHPDERFDTTLDDTLAHVLSMLSALHVAVLRIAAEVEQLRPPSSP